MTWLQKDYFIMDTDLIKTLGWVSGNRQFKESYAVKKKWGVLLRFVFSSF